MMKQDDKKIIMIFKIRFALNSRRIFIYFGEMLCGKILLLP
ncbi:hypothetical protein PPM_4664 [Paenibacillus polymyxa M1]|nr:hypothetical protein PPM_4664 [Paenibacillus polymyxa M1]